MHIMDVWVYAMDMDVCVDIMAAFVGTVRDTRVHIPTPLTPLTLFRQPLGDAHSLADLVHIIVGNSSSVVDICFFVDIFVVNASRALYPVSLLIRCFGVYHRCAAHMARVYSIYFVMPPCRTFRAV